MSLKSDENSSAAVIILYVI